MMGLALYFVWESKSKHAYKATLLFAAQFALNIAWSFLFFGLRSPFYGFVEIIVLWLAIAATIIAFNRVSKTAAYLLLPYIFWVTFAACLNYAVMVLNA